jgi:hypothetical protein
LCLLYQISEKATSSSKNTNTPQNGVFLTKRKVQRFVIKNSNLTYAALDKHTVGIPKQFKSTTYLSNFWRQSVCN